MNINYRMRVEPLKTIEGVAVLARLIVAQIGHWIMQPEPTLERTGPTAVVCVNCNRSAGRIGANMLNEPVHRVDRMGVSGGRVGSK